MVPLRAGLSLATAGQIQGARIYTLNDQPAMAQAFTIGEAELNLDLTLLEHSESLTLSPLVTIGEQLLYRLSISFDQTLYWPGTIELVLDLTDGLKAVNTSVSLLPTQAPATVHKEISNDKKRVFVSFTDFFVSTSQLDGIWLDVVVQVANDEIFAVQGRQLAVEANARYIDSQPDSLRPIVNAIPDRSELRVIEPSPFSFPQVKCMEQPLQSQDIVNCQASLFNQGNSSMFMVDIFVTSTSNFFLLDQILTDLLFNDGGVVVSPQETFNISFTMRVINSPPIGREVDVFIQTRHTSLRNTTNLPNAPALEQTSTLFGVREYLSPLRSVIFSVENRYTAQLDMLSTSEPSTVWPNGVTPGEQLLVKLSVQLPAVGIDQLALEMRADDGIVMLYNTTSLVYDESAVSFVEPPRWEWTPARQGIDAQALNASSSGRLIISNITTFGNRTNDYLRRVEFSLIAQVLDISFVQTNQVLEITASTEADGFLPSLSISSLLMRTLQPFISQDVGIEKIPGPVELREFLIQARLFRASAQSLLTAYNIQIQIELPLSRPQLFYRLDSALINGQVLEPFVENNKLIFSGAPVLAAFASESAPIELDFIVEEPSFLSSSSANVIISVFYETTTTQNAFIPYESSLNQTSDMTPRILQSIRPLLVPDSSSQLLLRDDLFVTMQQEPVFLDVLANDDPTLSNLSPLNASSLIFFDGPLQDLETLGENNTHYYRPPVGFWGSVTFAYSVETNDSPPVEGKARVVVTVLRNLYPITAISDYATCAPSTHVVIDVLDNDIDLDSQQQNRFLLSQQDQFSGKWYSVTIVQQPQYSGNVSVFLKQQDNQQQQYPMVRYTPPHDFHGTDSFVYLVCDGIGRCDSAFVYVSVLNIPPSGLQRPLARSDEVFTQQDQTVLIQVLQNDSPSSSLTTLDPSSVSSVSSFSQMGGIVQSSLLYPGQIQYTPQPLTVGQDEFEYIVCDTQRICSDKTKVIVHILANHPPLAKNDYFFAANDVNVVPMRVLLNDFDPDDGLDSTTLQIVRQPSVGSVRLSTDIPGIILFSATNLPISTLPMQLDNIFAYRICDFGNQCAVANVSVLIQQDRPPVAVDDHYSMLDNNQIILRILLNDYDPDGNLDVTSLSFVNVPSFGIVSVTDFAIAYAPVVRGPFIDSFTYQICDTLEFCDTALVTIDVRPNNPPLANDDKFVSLPGKIHIFEPMLNDVDPEGNIDLSSFLIIEGPSLGGGINYNPTTGEYTYSAPTGPEGAIDEITYEICDSSGLCDRATIQIKLNANNNPNAANDVGSVKVGESVDIDVLRNDGDDDGNLDPTSVRITVSPSKGSASVGESGIVRYTPFDETKAGEIDTFRYEVCDEIGLCAFADVLVGVVSGYPRPIANDDEISTPQNTPVNVKMLENDVNVRLGETVVSLFSPPSQGSAFYNPQNGVFVVTPDADFIGDIEFEYRICTPSGVCDIGKVKVTIVENTPPIANDDFVDVASNTESSLPVANNDSDENLDLGSIVIVGAPANGTATIDPNQPGRIIYTPSPNFIGTDVIEYYICDISGDCSDVASVFIQVLGNLPPIPATDYATTLSSIPITINVVLNDVDPDNNLDVGSVGLNENPASGTAIVLTPSGKIVYTPSFGFAGRDTFKYNICDMQKLCVSASVVVDVNSNTPPVARNDVIYLDQLVDSTLIDILSNDYDRDDNLVAASVEIIVDPSRGEAKFDPTTSLVEFSPISDFFSQGGNGMDTFEYRVYDEAGEYDDATVTIVIAVPTPVAVDDNASTAPNTPIVIDVLVNDVDPADLGFVLPLSIVMQPTEGSVVVNDDGIIEYTPFPSHSGIDTFAYLLCNTLKQCDVASVTVYTAPNSPPMVVDDEATVVEGRSVSVDVLLNDSDPDGNLEPNTLKIVGAPLDGTVFIGPDGRIVFTPSPGGSKTLQIEYEVCDAANQCSTGTLTITVISNNPPIAQDDSAVISSVNGAIVTISVLNNDSDEDGNLDGQSLEIISDSLLGNVKVNLLTGVIQYELIIPTGGTEDTFDYQICDSLKECVSATVTIHIIGNTPPTARDDSIDTLEDQPIIISVLNNDSDAEGNLDPTTVQILPGGPTNGVVTVNPENGKITYTPNEGNTGLDSFDYQVCDTTGSCDSASVTINVIPKSPPVTSPDSVTTSGETVVSVRVLDNDVGVDGPLDPETLIVYPPTNGTVVIGPGPEIIYTPPSGGLVGPDTFDYEICDIYGSCSIGTVTVNFIPPGSGSPPIAQDDNVQIGPRESIEIRVLDNDSDSDGDLIPSSVSILFGPQFGEIVDISGSGVVTYRAFGGYTNVDDKFVYQICDSENQCVQANVVITILADTQGVVALDDIATTQLNQPVSIDVVDNDYDPDGNLDRKSVKIVDGSVIGGNVRITDDNNIVFTPLPGLIGRGVFEYDVCDTLGNCGRATVIIVVIDPFPPMAVDDITTTKQDLPVGVSVFDNDNTDGMTTFSIIAQPNNGSAVIDATGVTYTPDSDFVGVDTIRYQICKGSICAEAVLTVVVTQSNPPPVARDDYFLLEDNSNGDRFFDILRNDNHPDGVIVSSLTTVDLPENGGSAVWNDSQQRLVYTPPGNNYNGPNTIVYYIEDDKRKTSSATVYIFHNPTPIDVEAFDHFVQTGPLKPVSIGLLAKNVDPFLSPSDVTITLINPPPLADGTLSQVDLFTGGVIFTPDPSFSGSTTQFVYQLCFQSVCDQATVYIDVSSCPFD